ncbi:MAG: DinB family protein [Chloroflexia bacterium]|nr:DinB family protein [Chloroflexia bacterium]
MAFSWNQALLDQLDFAWNDQFMPRMAGLSDDEYFWEPVAGCWSVRPTEGGRYAMDAPVGRIERSAAPFTTIAWRLGHIATFFGERASNHFGDGTFSAAAIDWPATADSAIAMVEREYRRWREGVQALGEDGLLRPCGPAEGPFSDDPLADLVLHINREFLHHAAEVAMLRDLYRDTVAKGALILNSPAHS